MIRAVVQTKKRGYHMKVTIITIWLTVVMTLCASVAMANSKTFTPPSNKGDIYVVCNYKMSSIGLPQKTSVSIRWGGWIKNDTVNVYTVYGMQGFIVKLKHKKNDSYPLSFSTSGTIVRGPYQGSAPSEWGRTGWKKYEW